MLVLRTTRSCPVSLTFLFVLALALAACDSGGSGDEADDGPYPALRRQSSFPVGVAITTDHLGEPSYQQVIKRVFNSLSGEYEMKPATIWRGIGQYNWGPADLITAFAFRNDMRVHGHTLVWHSSTPAFIQNFRGTDEAFDAAVRQYITDVVTRYRLTVDAWDVVNEAFDDGNGQFRNTVFRQRMGPDYVAKCFQYAREADPNVLLFYNDYGTIWNRRKADAMFAMIDDFQARGIPIDGVGLQMHISHNWPAMADIQRVVDGIVERGLMVHISELDIKINPDNAITAPTPERLESQKQRMMYIVEMYRRIPARLQYGITLWGLSDKDSWLIDFEGRPDWPLLFDANLEPKPAYFGFLESLD